MRRLSPDRGPSATGRLETALLAGDPQMAIERVAAADDVERQRVESGQVLAVEDVGDVLERDRLPDVHSHQHVVLLDALLGGWPARADGDDAEAPAIARAQLLERRLVHRRQPHPERRPDAV